jgi:hypothetical protein
VTWSVVLRAAYPARELLPVAVGIMRTLPVYIASNRIRA